jgi:hypothetical protein
MFDCNHISAISPVCNLINAIRRTVLSSTHNECEVGVGVGVCGR